MQITYMQNHSASHLAIPLTLRAVVLIWLLPVLFTLAKASASVILTATTAAFVFCVCMQLLNSYTLPYILPFIALLSPMTGFIKLGGASLLYSDLLFPLLAVQTSLIVISRPPKRIPKLFFLLGVMAIVATIAGVATGLSWLKPLLYLLQMALVVFFTLRAVKDPYDLALLLNAWIAAAAMGSAILLQAYFEGRSLILVQEIVQERTVSTIDLVDLFRSSYYYTNFHYVLGLCIVWLALRLLLPSTILQRFWALAASSFFVLALISTANKTSIFSTGLALALTVLLLLHRYSREMFKVMSIAVLPAIAVFSLAAWNFTQFVGGQTELISSRLVDANSFFVRLEVFHQALNVWVSSPLNALLGYGPSMLEGPTNSNLSVLFKTSAVTGAAEGALDSAWLSYLVELGVPCVLLLVALFARGILNSLRGLRNCPRLDEYAFAEASLFGGLVYLVIAMSTQMIGYSKISWLPLQLLVVSAVGLRRSPA
jgi:hypothetical protein